MLEKNSKQFCFDRTRILTRSIKKYLKRNSIPVVDQNGELVIEVQIQNTHQVKTIAPVVVEKVVLRGILFQRALFNAEFDQSGQKNKKSDTQIGKILADKIINSIQSDGN